MCRERHEAEHAAHGRQPDAYQAEHYAHQYRSMQPRVMTRLSPELPRRVRAEQLGNRLIQEQAGTSRRNAAAKARQDHE